MLQAFNVEPLLKSHQQISVRIQNKYKYMVGKTSIQCFALDSKISTFKKGRRMKLNFANTLVSHFEVCFQNFRRN